MSETTLERRSAPIAHPPEWPVYDEDTAGRVAGLVRRGRTFDYHHGPELTRLEEAFSAAHGGRYAVALNSGTSALLAGYYALGLGPGDEVIVPSLTFLATASTLFLLGGVPVLADSAGPAGLVSAATIEPLITPRTRAITVTHLFGHPAPLAEIRALADRYGLAVLEDCSHAHGSTYRGQPVGTVGDVAVFSTGGVKLVSGGMGGVLLTSTARQYDLACLLSAFRQRSELTVMDPALRRLADVGLGGNLRMSPLAAVLAGSHLARLDELVATKRANAERLLAALTGHPAVTAPGVAAGATMGAWYDLVVAVDPVGGFDRDRLVAELRARGLKVNPPRTGPLHRTSVFTGERPGPWPAYDRQTPPVRFDYRPDALPHAGALHDSWLSVQATYFNVPGDLADAYADAIEDAYRSLG